MGAELERFAENTLEYLRQERHLAPRRSPTPRRAVDFKGRHVLIVVRGPRLQGGPRRCCAARATSSEMRPVLIGVDGGADALLEIGPQARHHHRRLGLGVRARAALRRRARRARLRRTAGRRAPSGSTSSASTTSCSRRPGTSEDIAMLLAYERGRRADRRGGHPRLDGRVPRQGPGRHGSTFLVRLKVGPDPRRRQGREPALPEPGAQARPVLLSRRGHRHRA